MSQSLLILAILAGAVAATECNKEYLNAFQISYGYENTNCSFYDSAEVREWMPNAYLDNAKCACSTMPNCPSATCVRKYIQVGHHKLLGISPEIKARAKELKKNGGALLYHQFVQEELVPFFYKEHVNAYEVCGCPSGPAPYWAWQAVSIVKHIPCPVIKHSIFQTGPCHGIRGYW